MEQKIIDAHMHITQWVNHEEISVFDSVRQYQEDNRIACVDNMCCSNLGDLWAGYEMDQSILGAIAKLDNPTVFAHGCLYLPRDHSQIAQYRFKDQLEELMEIGLDGVKICEFKPDAFKLYRIDDWMREYEEYIDACWENKVHMCWHVADPPTCWDGSQVSEYFRKVGWFYGDGAHLSYDEFIAMTYRLLDRHPDLNVMLAHAFFKSQEPDEVEALLNKYPNVTIDLAPGSEMFDGFRTHYEKWHRLFRVYSDRFLYATDATMTTSRNRMGRVSESVLKFLNSGEVFVFGGGGGPEVHGIDLEQEHLDRVLYQNHERTVGKKPREINKKALKKYIDRYLPLMPDSRNKQMTQAYYRKNLLD